MAEFRWCFIGAGKLARQVAQKLRHSGHRIVSVYSRRFEQAQAFAARTGAAAYRTAEEAVSDVRADGVYVVTPHDSHFAYAKLALEKGIPVLVEKPLTVNLAQAEELVRLAREKKVYLAEAMWTWFFDCHREALARVRAGKLGKILSVRANYCHRFLHFAPRLIDPARAGGALLDIGVYPIAYVCRLFGAPDSVECRGKLRGGIDLSEDVTLFYPDFCARVCVSMTDLRGEFIDVRGEKGRLFSRNFHHSGRAVFVSEGRRELLRGAHGMRREFDIVAAEIRAGRTESLCAPLGDTLAVLAVLDECRRQMGLSYPCE